MQEGISQFYQLAKSDYHQSRKREMMVRYGQRILSLQGPYTPSVLWIAALVAASYSLSWLMRDQSWPVLILSAFALGAFLHHALYVLIHECTHNLVWPTRLGNKIMGLVCDLPLVFPSAMAFRKYHMYHHRHLGHRELDPDVPPVWEAKLIGTSSWRKALWIAGYFLSQAIRPGKLTSVRMMNGWMAFNIALIIFVNMAVFYFLGPKVLAHLFLSTAFALGLHPLGGRWIQEHFVTQKGQETYSYYGPLNKLCFNMGYHNEHHDFMSVPWVHLPKLKALAPEYYDNLKSYQSWTGVIANFVFNPAMGPFARYVHEDRQAKMEQEVVLERSAQKSGGVGAHVSDKGLQTDI